MARKQYTLIKVIIETEHAQDILDTLILFNAKTTIKYLTSEPLSQEDMLEMDKDI